MHAISRDAMVFPHTECLYLMIDAKLVDSVPGTPASTPGMDLKKNRTYFVTESL